jgi:hypothetical protein
MDRELELIQKVDSLEQKTDRNHRLLLTGLSAISAGICAAALGLALGYSVRGAALGCIVAGVVTVLIGLRRKAFAS